MIRHWFEPHARKLRAERKKRAEHERGYAYAAGELLHSDGAAQERLEYEVDASYHYSNTTEFDHGITHALNDWRKLHAPRWRFIE